MKTIDVKKQQNIVGGAKKYVATKKMVDAVSGKKQSLICCNNLITMKTLGIKKQQKLMGGLMPNGKKRSSGKSPIN